MYALLSEAGADFGGSSKNAWLKPKGADDPQMAGERIRQIVQQYGQAQAKGDGGTPQGPVYTASTGEVYDSRKFLAQNGPGANANAPQALNAPPKVNHLVMKDANAQNALAGLLALNDPLVNKLISDLQTGPHTHTVAGDIVPAAGNDLGSNQHGIGPRFRKEIHNGVGVDTTTNIISGEIVDKFGRKRTPIDTLAHELYHVWEKAHGQIDYSIWRNASNAYVHEQRAVRMQNYVRSLLKLPPLLFYGDPANVVVNPTAKPDLTPLEGGIDALYGKGYDAVSLFHFGRVVDPLYKGEKKEGNNQEPRFHPEVRTTKKS